MHLCARKKTHRRRRRPTQRGLVAGERHPNPPDSPISIPVCRISLSKKTRLEAFDAVWTINFMEMWMKLHRSHSECVQVDSGKKRKSAAPHPPCQQFPAMVSPQPAEVQLGSLMMPLLNWFSKRKIKINQKIQFAKEAFKKHCNLATFERKRRIVYLLIICRLVRIYRQAQLCSPPLPLPH